MRNIELIKFPFSMFLKGEIFMKRIITLLGCFILSGLAFVGCGGSPKDPTASFAEIIENVEELTLTIYYLSPNQSTGSPLNLQGLSNRGNRNVVYGNELKEHLELFRQLYNQLSYNPPIPIRGEVEMYARLHYVFTTSTGQEVISFAQRGFRANGDGTTAEVIFINGQAFYQNDIFIQAVLPFLPSDVALRLTPPYNREIMPLETGCTAIARRIVSVEEREEWKAWTIEQSQTGRRRYDLGFLTSGNFVPAANDIDLQTIERFIFTHGGFHSGFGIAIDRMHGMVYYDPHSSHFVHRLNNNNRFYAEYIEEDFTRLIQAIEESGLRDWHGCYCGEFDRYIADSGLGWSVGILFADGSILRRRGSGRHGNTDWLPPEDEFAILTSFVRTLGAEIIERHNNLPNDK